jgi:CheB methylesterase
VSASAEQNASGLAPRQAVAGHDIVVGASAGGIDALDRIIPQLPEDLPAAIFVAMHLAPDARSSRGGVTVVQDPDDALHPGMSRHAIAQDEPRHVMPASEIAALITHLALEPVKPPQHQVGTAESFDDGTVVGLSCPECGGPSRRYPTVEHGDSYAGSVTRSTPRASSPSRLTRSSLRSGPRSGPCKSAEELETMNEELRRRSRDLDRSNALMETVLGQIKVAVIVVDRRDRRS